MKTAWLLVSIIHLNCGLVYSLDAQKAVPPGCKPNEAFLGVRLQNLPEKAFSSLLKIHPLPRGVVQIRDILPDTAAARSQLSQCDLIIGIDGETLDDREPTADFTRIIKDHAPDDPITLSGFSVKHQVLFNGQKIDLKQYGFMPLGMALQKNGFWQDTTIKRQLILEPFLYEIVLGSQSDYSGKRDLPGTEGVLSDFDPLFQDPEPFMAPHKVFLERFTQTAELIKQDAFTDIYGAVHLETLLHQRPDKIHVISQRIAQLLAHEKKSIFSKGKFLLCGDTVLESPALPPLPKTEKEALQQLIYLVQTKRDMEQQFFQEKGSFSFLDAKNTIRKLKLQYKYSCPTHEPDCRRAHNSPTYKDIEDLESTVSYEKMLSAGEFLVEFFSEKRLMQLKNLLAQNKMRVLSQQDIKIIVGSAGDDLHVQEADLILDFSGNDSYLSWHPNQGKEIIIDISGTDLYQSQIPFQLGGTLLKASFLLDLEGDDTYIAKSCSLGAGFGGIGIVMDHDGDDLYRAKQLSMGIGLFGIGILHDYAGTDRYISGYRAQGVGLMGGLGILTDEKGDDQFLSEGLKPSGYEEPEMYDGFSQGVGVGLRNLGRGGTGILVDYYGNDTYRSGNFAQGTGYYFGAGSLFDFSGDDKYYCSRYGLGASAHSASGIFMDFSGDDAYHARVQAACGSAWDLSSALFYDKAGDDRYTSSQHFSFGAADHNSLAFHYDLAGNDGYEGGFYTSQSNAYHGGHSAGIFINQGGMDKYPQPFLNNISEKHNEFLFIDQLGPNSPP